MPTTVEPKPIITSIAINGRRWYQRSGGNTYHTVEVSINGEVVWTSDRTCSDDDKYWPRDMYIETATDWLDDNDHLLGLAETRISSILWLTSTSLSSLFIEQYCRENNIELVISVIDVPRRKDL